MWTISKLGRRFGLSRSTLLYYDRRGLLSPSERSGAGYRLYSEEDAARLGRICTYRRAGLSLEEVQAVLDATGSGRLETALRKRLEELQGEISSLRHQQRVVVELLRQNLDPKSALDLQPLLSEAGLLNKEAWVSILRATGLSDEEMLRWHVEFERQSPEGHQDFLEALGIQEEEVESIRRWSREGVERVPASTDRFPV